ncbi:hypothetical protein [Paenibacillus terrigena]|uniref:prenylated flavin chaperone LpdD n=1 Tax=Paenibacillus terrigena TaxID=369333 RepID=UPI00037D9FE6|nr:hypothetical protein [Paenibacillus terrigena]
MFEQSIIPCVGSEITFSVVAQGEDLCVTIAGGTKPHIGAVALAQVRPSLADSSRLSASVSVLTLLGHKEDEIAKYVAQQIAVARGANVVVSCGVHIDHASLDQLQEIDQAIRTWCADFVRQIS